MRLYSLSDPRAPLIPRYYGQTIKPLERRLQQHVTSATRGDRRHVARWIRGLLLAGIRPWITPIADARDREELDKIEVEAIRAAREAGIDLCNLTDGGGGAKGWTAPPETRERMSLSARGPRKPRSAETRAKLSVANMGKRATEETRAKLSAVLKGKKKPPRTPEHAAKIVAARAGWRPTPEQIAKKAASMRAAWASNPRPSPSVITRMRMSIAARNRGARS